MLTQQRRLAAGQAGFSLIEVMIVVTIMGVLMAIGIPSYRTWIENTKIRNAAESVVSGLTLARSEAVLRNAPVQLVLGAGSDSGWTVGCQTVTATCPALIHQRTTAEGSSGKVNVDSVSGRTIRFNNLGRMVLPALAAPATSIDIAVSMSNTSLSSSVRRDLRVTVGLGGATRMCDPSILATSTDPRKC